MSLLKLAYKKGNVLMHHKIYGGLIEGSSRTYLGYYRPQCAKFWQFMKKVGKRFFVMIMTRKRRATSALSFKEKSNKI
uniref:Uncharacterized protein n=1 Tax=Romanomermis culicivorax TaxID=13658 RepID=A0A915KYS4_ROMCU